MSHRNILKIFIVFVLSSMALSLSVFCQQQTPKAGVSAADDEVQLTSDLVLMNVTVTGSQGGFIRNLTKHSLDDALKKALTANISIFSIDLIGSIDSGRTTTEEMQGHAILKQIAEKTGGRYLLSPGGRQLTESLTKIAEELNNQYTVGYY